MGIVNGEWVPGRDLPQGPQMDFRRASVGPKGVKPSRKRKVDDVAGAVADGPEAMDADDDGAAAPAVVMQQAAVATAKRQRVEEEVETVLAGRYPLRSIEIDFDDSLDRPIGGLSMRFDYLYFTPAGNPGVSA